MCISWAWNKDKVQHATFDLSKYNLLKKDDDADYELLKLFSSEVKQAELLVGQNSVNFDWPTITSRLVKYKLPPLPLITQDDTYLQSKNKIKHISHKLDDVGDYLGYGKKANHGNGMDWWIEVMYGNDAILNRMVKYCDEDVNKLRKIYIHQLPYVKSNFNMVVWVDGRPCCPSPACGSPNLTKNGYRRTNAGKFQRYSCNTCGRSDITDGTNLIKHSGKVVRNG